MQTKVRKKECNSVTTGCFTNTRKLFNISGDESENKKIYMRDSGYSDDLVLIDRFKKYTEEDF